MVKVFHLVVWKEHNRVWDEWVTLPVIPKQCSHLQIVMKHLACCFVGVPYNESKPAMTIWFPVNKLFTLIVINSWHPANAILTVETDTCSLNCCTFSFTLYYLVLLISHPDITMCCYRKHSHPPHG